MDDYCTTHHCTCHLSPPCSACVDCDNGECPGAYVPDMSAPAAEWSRPGCQGRGWYHDGSEQQEATAQNRTPRPCPHCTA